MEEINQKYLTGERALFMKNNLKIINCTFDAGESPLKECSNLDIENCMFKWKYPLWYSKHIKMTNSSFFDMARAGIWYTDDITIKNCSLTAPKTFRRCNKVSLEDVTLPVALETFWNCKNVTLKNVSAHGDYFAMNCENMEIDNFNLLGNYSFDGAKNIVIKNSKLLSKDAFWNSENVTVYDSFISGEYLGWNSKNLTLVNCTIESLQGMCYIENLTLKNCKLLNTTLAFEYAQVDADIVGEVDSIFNPTSGTIKAESIAKLIIEKDKIDPSKTKIICSNIKEHADKFI